LWLLAVAAVAAAMVVLAVAAGNFATTQLKVLHLAQRRLLLSVQAVLREVGHRQLEVSQGPIQLFQVHSLTQLKAEPVDWVGHQQLVAPVELVELAELEVMELRAAAVPVTVHHPHQLLPSLEVYISELLDPMDLQQALSVLRLITVAVAVVV
jgi:hypothetical protein